MCKEMQNIYYRSLDLVADLEMVEMINQIKADDRFELVKEPEHVLVHKMEYRGQKRDEHGMFQDDYEDVGTYEGYYWHYFYFKCKRTGVTYNVNKNTWYPFDGKWDVRVGNGLPREFESLEKYA